MVYRIAINGFGRIGRMVLRLDEKGVLIDRSYVLIPIAGRILVCAYWSNSVQAIAGVLSSNKLDAQGMHFGQSKFWAVDETDHIYFMDTEFEENYDKNKDKLRFLFFLKSYYQALVE